MGEEASGNERRAEILEASLRLFIRKGYSGTTTRAITASMGISTGLLFHYFPTKKEILEELARNSSAAMAMVNRILKSRKPPAEIFASVSRTILESLDDPLALYYFSLVNQIKTLDSIPASVKGILESHDNIADSVPVIRKGQAEGLFKAGAPATLSIAYWGAVQGIAEASIWYPEIPLPGYECVLGILVRESAMPRA